MNAQFETIVKELFKKKKNAHRNKLFLSSTGFHAIDGVRVVSFRYDTGLGDTQLVVDAAPALTAMQDEITSFSYEEGVKVVSFEKQATAATPSVTINGKTCEAELLDPPFRGLSHLPTIGAAKMPRYVFRSVVLPFRRDMGDLTLTPTSITVTDAAGDSGTGELEASTLTQTLTIAGQHKSILDLMGLLTGESLTLRLSQISEGRKTLLSCVSDSVEVSCMASVKYYGNALPQLYSEAQKAMRPVRRVFRRVVESRNWQRVWKVTELVPSFIWKKGYSGQHLVFCDFGFITPPEDCGFEFEACRDIVKHRILYAIKWRGGISKNDNGYYVPVTSKTYQKLSEAKTAMEEEILANLKGKFVCQYAYNYNAEKPLTAAQPAAIVAPVESMPEPEITPPAATQDAETMNTKNVFEEMKKKNVEQRKKETTVKVKGLFVSPDAAAILDALNASPDTVVYGGLFPLHCQREEGRLTISEVNGDGKISDTWAFLQAGGGWSPERYTRKKTTVTPETMPPFDFLEMAQEWVLLQEEAVNLDRLLNSAV